MKAILEFDLPEDKDDLNQARNGNAYWCILWGLEQFLRRKVHKGEHDYKSADEALKAVWDYLYMETDWGKYEDDAQ